MREQPVRLVENCRLELDDPKDFASLRLCVNQAALIEVIDLNA
jgi:hypothetical protein